MEKKVTTAAVCQNCANYDRTSKKCGLRGTYTARKNSCTEFTGK